MNKLNSKFDLHYLPKRLLKSSFFRFCVKGAVVFTFLVLWLILVKER